MAPTPTVDGRRTIWRSEKGTLSISERAARPQMKAPNRACATAAARFALALAEVLAGRRPAAQLAHLSKPGTIAELVRVQAESPLTGARLHSIHISDSVSAGSAEVVACYEWRPNGGRGARLVGVAFQMTRTDNGWACRALTIGVPNVESTDRRR
ncbi:Rv3235 family protein [Propionibacterium australiense]|uniref:Uncharacterized protein n=1 Tax=Propionibacterium australiense TaxID=119981 RepID=A0A383S331_9ACTN|nr:Rv3235 family protein [Propionibacterium australiense]RLP11708.1 hypothetical protein D9T14_03705 [Propionibacterium australiense]RLP12221.1 hypothetical protein D7U36_02890 [Propionibacterium australiense]SYZ32448.1 Hypothetical protein PROPAUS_0327 [Propionibacterium australiense]VEH90191.1 Uncharacterised protein [Propionibacterium australiense]